MVGDGGKGVREGRGGGEMVGRCLYQSGYQNSACPNPPVNPKQTKGFEPR